MTERTGLNAFPGYSARAGELRALGFSKRRLMKGDMVRAARGVIVHPATVDHESPFGRCRALLPVLTQGHFFSMRTALALYGLPIRVPERIDIGAQLPKTPPRRPEIAGHRVRSGLVQVRLVRGLPVASPADAWCLVARAATLSELVQFGDALLSGVWSDGRRGAPLLTFDDLAHTIECFSRIPGASLRRQAFPLLRAPVDSFAETSIRLLLLEHGFPEPVIQCRVHTRRRTYRADLGYPELRIAIEYEGAYHFQGGVEQARRDVERWEEMTAAGWRVLRVTARDLRNPGAFLGRLREAVVIRSAHTTAG